MDNEFEKMQEGLSNAKYLLIFCIIFYCIYLLTACNVSKKIEREDNNALQRVTAKRPLLDVAGAKWRDLNPCANDTTVITKEGATVTLTDIDTIYVPGTNDTVIKTVTKTVTHNKVDTLVRTVVDKNAQDSAFAYAHRIELQIKDKEVVIATTQNELKEASNSKSKWKVYFFLLAAGTGALSFLYVKQQFFKI